MEYQECDLEEQVQGRAAVIGQNFRWPRARLPYEIDRNFRKCFLKTAYDYHQTPYVTAMLPHSRRSSKKHSRRHETNVRCDMCEI